MKPWPLTPPARARRPPWFIAACRVINPGVLGAVRIPASRAGALGRSARHGLCGKAAHPAPRSAHNAAVKCSSQREAPRRQAVASSLIRTLRVPSLLSSMKAEQLKSES